jgi:hypothetical protein
MLEIMVQSYEINWILPYFSVIMQTETEKELRIAMPRKTGGILFELQPRPTMGDDGKSLLYAQPVIERKHDIDDIDDFCAKYRHTSKGEMKRLFELFSEVATMWLRQGHRVETPFGSLARKLKLLGDHTAPDKATGRDVMYAGIEFIPAKQFVLDADCSGDGFHRKKGRVGNSRCTTPRRWKRLCAAARSTAISPSAISYGPVG